MDRSVPLFGRLRDVVRASFRRKLAVALLIVFLVVSLVTVGLYVQIGALLDENVEQSMTAAASAEANELNEWSGQHRLLARVLSEHPVYESGNVSEIRVFLEAQHSGRQEASVVRAYVVDRRNQTVTASSDTRLEGQRVSDLPWEEPFSFRDFDDVQSTRPYEVENGTTVVGFIAPIRRLPGSLLVVEIDTESVFERFEHPVDGGFTRVVNSNGTVVFADDGDAALTQYSEGTQRAPIVSSGLRGESGFTDSPTYDGGDSGSEYVAAYDSVPGTNWVVVEHAPAEEAYVITRRGRTWIGGIAVVALAALFVVVGVLGTDVTTALSRLTDRARRIEAGEYDVQFETDRPDEFGDLNRTLESTRDTLHARIEELRETKADLESSNTALEERSAMVSVLNRILRHNVRNDVNVITGRTELAVSRTDDEVIREDLEAVKGAAWTLAELSERTQRIQQLLSEAESETEPLQLEPCLSSALADIGESGADVTITVDSEATTTVEGPPMLPVAIADVVEQIISHNDESVRVDITIADDETGDDDGVVIYIDDDGGGLPELDVRAVGTGEETPLNHGKGLALWCLEWTVSKAGGELDVDPTDATLEIRLLRSNN